MRYLLFALLSSSLFAFGCNNAGDPGASAGTGTDSTSAEPLPTEPAGAAVDSPAPDATTAETAATDETVSLKTMSWQEAQDLVKAHKGKVVVMDVWSTSCLPCMKEFPNLVALHEKYGEDQVACISVSCDYEGIKGKPPESYRDRVLAFLKKQNATFENVLSNVESDKVFEMMDVASIPTVYVYDSEGNLKKRFDNDSGEYFKDGGEGFTYEEHIIPLVEEMLATSAR